METPSQNPDFNSLPEGLRNRLSQLRQLETLLGNLHPSFDASSPLQTYTVAELQMQMSDDSQVECDTLFKNICQELLALGHSPDASAEVINKALQTSLSIPYCNGKDILEAIV